MTKKLPLWLNGNELSKALGVSAMRISGLKTKGIIKGIRKGNNNYFNWWDVGPKIIARSRTLTMTDFTAISKRLLAEKGRPDDVTSEDLGVGNRSGGSIPESIQEDPSLSSVWSLTESRAKKEQFLAAKAELEYKQLQGELVKVSHLAGHLARLGTITKKALLNIPDRCAALVAAESKRAACHVILDREIKKILENLANELNRLSPETEVD